MHVTGKQTVETALLKKAQAGDTYAQGVFLREMGPHIAGLVRRLGNRAELDDQLQELFEHLLKVLPKFEPNGTAKLSTWVFSVSHRWLLMQKRKRGLTLVPLDEAVPLEAQGVRPEAYTHERQLQALLELAVQKLPEEQRRVFVLAQVHHQPLEAIAQAEGVPLGTVKSRLHRARAELLANLRPALTAQKEETDAHA